MTEAPLPTNAIGTIELFTLQGDSPDDVKIKLTHDIPSTVNPAIREQIMNVLFGFFYDFMTDEPGLASKGEIFRAGMRFQSQYKPPPPDDRGPRKPKPKPEGDPDGDVMKPVRDLEKLLKDK